MKTNSNCIFCKMGEDSSFVPTQRLKEEKEYFVILSLNPQTRGHSLIIPRRHYTSLARIPRKLQTMLFGEAIAVGELFQKVLHARAYVVKVNNNLYKLEEGGHIGHIHVHIIPRYKKNEQLREKPKKAFIADLRKIKGRLSL